MNSKLTARENSKLPLILGYGEKLSCGEKSKL